MAEPRVFKDVDDLKGAVGEQLGYSDWVEIEQSRIDQFAEATGDHQWIHVDPERAKEGPFKTTIAHGYLTLSLLPLFGPQLMKVEGMKMGVNYGTNKVRFPAPVPVGSRLRATAKVTDVSDVAAWRTGHRGVQRGARGRRQAGVRRGVGVPLLPLTTSGRSPCAARGRRRERRPRPACGGLPR